MTHKISHYWGLDKLLEFHNSVTGIIEAMGGFEPPNRGFAVPHPLSFLDLTTKKMFPEGLDAKINLPVLTRNLVF
jgi:hypothetical protein